ncbi:hypothetical protein [Salinarimonas sp.]|uniref:hypothetical protein n=1 Tax=Salinarimonas sp. TaxID=2766526 RepID=UPI0032D905F9
MLVVAAILCGFALVGYVVERVAAPERDEDRRREDARLPRIRFDRVVACIGMAALNTAFVFAVVADPILFLTALFANIAAFAALAWLVRDREEPGTPSAPSAGRGEAT